MARWRQRSLPRRWSAGGAGTDRPQSWSHGGSPAPTRRAQRSGPAEALGVSRTPTADRNRTADRAGPIPAGALDGLPDECRRLRRLKDARKRWAYPAEGLGSPGRSRGANGWRRLKNLYALNSKSFANRSEIRFNFFWRLILHAADELERPRFSERLAAQKLGDSVLPLDLRPRERDGACHLIPTGA